MFHRVIRLALQTTDIYPLFAWSCISYPELRFNVKPHTHKLSDEVAVARIVLLNSSISSVYGQLSSSFLPHDLCLLLEFSRVLAALQVSLHFFHFSLRWAETAFTAPAGTHAGEHPHPFGSKGPENRWNINVNNAGRGWWKLLEVSLHSCSLRWCQIFIFF